MRGFYGSQGGSSLTKDTAVAVCTIEKANSLVNKLLEEGRLSEIAILVIDELHMVCPHSSIRLHLTLFLTHMDIKDFSFRTFSFLEQVGDRDRGYLLELLLTKLRYAAGGGECGTIGDPDPNETKISRSSGSSDLQIVGMSATMPNVSDVATWLEVLFLSMLF